MPQRSALSCALVASLAIAGTASAGTITGTVKLKVDAPAVVYVESVADKPTAPKEHGHIDQKGMMFMPYLLPVVVGTTVDFANNDAVNHNVFSPDGEGYNLGTWPKGESRSYTFKKEGVYTQLCSVHPEMEAFVVVLQNPYFAVVGKDGSYKIDGVADGHYVLKVFSKKLKKGDKDKKFPVDVTKGTGTTAIAF